MTAPAAKPVLALPPLAVYDALARSGIFTLNAETTPDDARAKFLALRDELAGKDALTVALARDRVLGLLRDLGYVDGPTILAAILGRPGDPRWTGVGAPLAGGDLLPVVHILEGDAPDPPGVLVDDLLVDADINLWAGQGGAAKSVAALVVAVSVALGRPVFDTLPVHRSGPVLLVCPEDGQAAIRMMLDAIASGLELEADARTLLSERLLFVPDETTVNLLTDTRRLACAVKDAGVVHVLVDPLRNSLGGADENDSALAGVVLDTTRRDVCRDAGATVLILTHTRKPGQDMTPDAAATVHELRGSSAWAAGARLVFGVTNRDGRVTLAALKANRLRANLRHELRLDIEADPAMPTRWRSCTLTDLNAGARSDALTPGVGRELNANERATLTALDDSQEPGARLSYSAWEKASGLKTDTWKGVRGRLLKAQLADAIATGRKTRAGGVEYAYTITDRGRQALAAGFVSDPDFEDRRGERVSNG